MTLPIQNTPPETRTETSDVSIIRREFVDLTGDHFSAVILNQLLYWTLRVKDFDHLLEEERHFQPDCNVSPRHGWIYKTADELNEETMLGISHPTMRKYLKLLIDQGWIDERANPVERWNKTTQYRVNIRQIQEDLSLIGRTLPHVYMKAFASSLQECTSSNGLQKPFKKVEEIPNVKNLHSNERILHSDENSEEPCPGDSLESEENSNVRNLHSNESCLHSNVKNFDSNVRNLHSYTYTETTSENISKEQLDAGARENFSDFENSVSGTFASDKSASEETDSENSCSANTSPENSVPDAPAPEKSTPGASVADEMLNLWERHVVQNLPAAAGNRRFQLTNERKDQLESLFAFHFQNDMRLWERFCLRVKASNFLMGGGESGWHVRLDWLLREGNLMKALAGKYDNSKKTDSGEWKLEKIQANPVLDAEKAAIIASIKDPTWRKWCNQLAAGVRLNEFKMVHEPLSVLQLQQIAHAWFLEVEDDRLVWVGSRDQRVLNKIDDLRLQIAWVFAKEYPNARTFRTRLEGSYNPQQAPHAGDIHHE